MSIFSYFRSVTPQLKRFESISRAKVFNICQEVMDNLVSVRAYQVCSNFVEMYRKDVAENIKMQLYASSVSKWMSFRLTMLGVVLAVLIVLVAMIIAPFSPEIAQYTPIIVTYAYLFQ
jgi:ATP-binding cassette subfamily C (CFTR/MRP) protein 10